MGISSSAYRDRKLEEEERERRAAQEEKYEIVKKQKEFQSGFDVPFEVLVAHFTPSTFPLTPMISPKLSQLCEQSWQRIVNKGNEKAAAKDGPTDCQTFEENENKSISGVTQFYVEFYDRLDKVDVGGKFEAILSRHASEGNKIAAKGAIILRIINFVLQFEKDSKQNQLILFMLGKSHAQKHIRPWQYSLLVETLLQTLASQLGPHATSDVMEAWVNLFAYVMKSMLPPAIKGQVLEHELNINTSSEFSAGRVAEEVREAEEVKDIRKRTSKQSGSQYQHSSYGGTARSSNIGGPFGGRMKINSARINHSFRTALTSLSETKPVKFGGEGNVENQADRSRALSVVSVNSSVQD